MYTTPLDTVLVLLDNCWHWLDQHHQHAVDDVDPFSDSSCRAAHEAVLSLGVLSEHSPRRAGLRSWDTRGLGPAGPNPL